MARGNHSNQRGGPGGGRGGRGNRGRGRGRGTGRGRGVSMESSMSFREDIDAGQIRGGYVPVNATDVPIQLWQGLSFRLSESVVV